MQEIKGSLNVTMKSREKEFFEGEAKSVTSSNDDGVFNVLPQHANFITMIKDFVKIGLEDGESKDFEISSGVLRVYEGKVDIFLTVS